MRVGIVGAGFVGLTTAYRLVKSGANVVIFEASEAVGGLASGFSLAGWDWPVERFYHHIFTGDEAIINLAREVGSPALFFRPTTSIYLDGKIYPFDSATHLLRFPRLSFFDRLRMGATLGFFKLSPFWQPLERFQADDFLKATMGEASYRMIWEPLLKAKFGDWYREVNAAWFWARIKKRSPKLGYFRGGFQGLADRIHASITSKGGSVSLNSPIAGIEKQGNIIEISTLSNKHHFEKVLVTTNAPIFLQMVKGLPAAYQKQLTKLKSLDALVVVMVSKTRLMEDVYWLNVIDSRLPFVVIVEHTNMVEPKYYGGMHVVYLGAYLPPGHRYFNYSDKKLVDMARQQIEEITNRFGEKDIVEAHVYRGKGVQPLVPLQYSAIKPTIETPIANLYLANIQMIYPWDRGTNYAVELGEEVAKLILKT